MQVVEPILESPILESHVSESVYSKSRHLYERLCQVIPGGVNSAGRAFKAVSSPPLIVERGEKDLLIDVDGVRYYDYCLSWGALMHGHAHPIILDAIRLQLEKGSSYGMSCGLEAELAEVICRAMPSIEQIRFVSSGTEATMSAVRLARAHTGRSKIVTCSGNYHGHADLFLVHAGSGLLTMNATASSAGVPQGVIQDTCALPFNDSSTMRAYLRREKVAAVILEPIAANMGVIPAQQEFLHMLREETERQGALLIFDEVVSGFRVARGGAQALYGIQPDLTCLGKIIGGGFPAAAFGGRKSLMQRLSPLGDVYQAGTLSGNPIAMCAGLEALRLLEDPQVYSALQKKADRITQPVREWAMRTRAPLALQQVGSMFTLFLGTYQVRNLDDVRKIDKQSFSALFAHMLANGVLIPPSPHEAWFVSTVHEEKHLDRTCALLLEFLETWYETEDK